MKIQFRYLLNLIFIFLIIELNLILILINPYSNLQQNNKNLPINNLQLQSNPFIKNWDNMWGLPEYNDEARAICLDSLGNIYLTGYTDSYGQPQGNNDIFIVKRTPNGNLIWYETWGGSEGGGERGEDIVIDSDENIYVTGSTTNYGAGMDDICIVKFNREGDFIWYQTWGGSNRERAVAIAIDSSDNLYIAGVTNSFGAGGSDLCVIKFDPSGNQLWNATWGGYDDEDGTDLIVDESGNVYLTGRTFSFDLGFGDACLIKYNQLGIQEWDRIWGGSSGEMANAILLDQSQNIYIAGVTGNYGNGYNDFFLTKYNYTGILQWYKTWGGANEDECRALSQDNNGNFYLAGNTESYGKGGKDICVVKVDHNGSIKGFQTWGGVEDEDCFDIKSDGYNNIYLTGYTVSTNQGFRDVVLISYLWIDLNYAIVAIVLSLFDISTFIGIFLPIELYRRKRLRLKGVKNEELEVELEFIPSLVQDSQYDSATNKLKEIIKTAEKYGLYKINQEATKYLHNIYLIIVKKTILDMSTKYTRVFINELVEKTNIPDKDTIIKTIEEMIENGEIYAKYFKNTESIAFDQQANIGEIDNLMKIYQEWENRGMGKKYD